MRGLAPALLASVTIVFTQSSAPPQSTEIENVVAFARLYGAVRYFYPGDAATTLDWNPVAVHGVNRVRSARDAAARQTTLEGLFAGLGPGIQIATALPAPPPSLPDSSLVAWRYVGPNRGARTNRVVASAPGTPQPAPPLPDGINLQDNVRLQTEDEIETGAHIDVDLVDGLKARVRLALTDTEARIESPEVKKLRAAVAGIADSSGRSDIDVRLADVVVAWNRFRHFYPYWTDTQVDWDAQLRRQLKVAYDAGTRDAHWRALRQLVNDAHDGHGVVTDVTGKELVRLPNSAQAARRAARHHRERCGRSAGRRCADGH